MRKWDDSCPIIIIPTTYYNTHTSLFKDMGVSTIIWANHLLRTSIQAMQKTANEIYNDQSVINVENQISSLQEIFRLQNEEELKKRKKNIYNKQTMLNPAAFIELCSKLNYSIYTGTPCSYMSSLFNHITGNKQLQYINVPNEGDAIGLATGAYLGGKKSIVMFQNSGLGNAINPLTSLSTVFQCPFIGLVSLREI